NVIDANSPAPVSGSPVAYAVMYMTPGVFRFEAIANPAAVPIPEIATDCALTTALSYVIVMSMPSTSLAVVIEIGTWTVAPGPPWAVSGSVRVAPLATTVNDPSSVDVGM